MIGAQRFAGGGQGRGGTAFGLDEARQRPLGF